MDIINLTQYTVAESFRSSPKSARYNPIPSEIFKTAIGKCVEDKTGGQLWFHQAKSLEILLQKQNVVISTGTASGKSLIFQSYAFHTTLQSDDHKVLIFYPLKALISDQMRSWSSFARSLNLPDHYVAKIDGSVPTQVREEVIQNSQIILMTPDVCHAWLMPRLAIPENKEFLKKLSVIVLDEAHTLEGVFGSNFSFLMRRIQTIRDELLRDEGAFTPLQFIAATATISNPQDHLKELTNNKFELVGTDDDGAPHAETLCAHIIAPAGEESELAKQLQKIFLSDTDSGGFITFMDSRKGVELLAHAAQNDIRDLVGENGVMPYRAGYDREDREKIEALLQNNELRGIVSTSALELGIDLPHLILGLNIGVPPTRKAYRQRLGRVGRTSEGAFLIIAPSNAFTAYGTTFKEYHEQSVEQSYLYLDNRFMQFAHSKCLIDELSSIGNNTTLHNKKRWPEDFHDIYSLAQPGGNRPPEFDMIAQLGGDQPHLCYPLRNVGEINFKITVGENADPFGEVNESQALRECYPGAMYYHLARTYKVKSWNTRAFIPFIKVSHHHPNRQTKPIIKTWINASVTPQDVIENHFLHGETGFITECNMQVTERVEGFKELPANVNRFYKDLRQQNPNFRPRSRNFRTTGIVICLNEEVFKIGRIKSQFTNLLKDIFVREYSVIPQDIGFSSTNISIRDREGGGLRGDCVVIFDQTYGSLRLTENLYLKFLNLLDRLIKSFDADSNTDLMGIVLLLKSNYLEWKSSVDYAFPEELIVPNDQKYIQVFAPNSIVSLREMGDITTNIRIVQPTLFDGKLMYQVECSAPNGTQRRWVSPSILEPTAFIEEWEYQWWNSQTEEFEDPQEEVNSDH